jgi:hypothetical protein
MPIDLSKFIGKTVIVTHRSAETCYCRVVDTIHNNPLYPYYVGGLRYTQCGYYAGHYLDPIDPFSGLSPFDIVKIEVLIPEPLITTMDEPQPMIDLSEYVDNVVKVTTYLDEVYTGLLQLEVLTNLRDKNPSLVWCPLDVNRYEIHLEGGGHLLYDFNGVNYSSTGYNIREIEILGPDPEPTNPGQGAQQTPEKANPLEPEALSMIASALTPGAIKFVKSHPEYAKVMEALIIEYVEKILAMQMVNCRL